MHRERLLQYQFPVFLTHVNRARWTLLHTINSLCILSQMFPDVRPSCMIRVLYLIYYCIIYIERASNFEMWECLLPAILYDLFAILLPCIYCIDKQTQNRSLLLSSYYIMDSFLWRVLYFYLMIFCDIRIGIFTHTYTHTYMCVCRLFDR